MTGRLNPVVAVVAAALLAAPLWFPGAAEAQDNYSAYGVVIPDSHATDGNDRGFGEDVAEELRELMESRPSLVGYYDVIERNEIDDAADEYDLEMRDLNCTLAKQLGGQMGYRLTFCLEYSSQGDDRVFTLVEVWDVFEQVPFEIEGFTVHKDDREEAAGRIADAFERFTQAVRNQQYCNESVANQEWEEALGQCNIALEAIPESLPTVALRANILRELGRYEEALEDAEAVLFLNPFDSEVLELAGYLATMLGREEDGRRYYGEYLELNPDNVDVRLNIAFDMADAGDPEGAMLFVEEGLEVEETTELLQAYGSYAFRAAQQASQAAQAENGSGPAPEVAELYNRAIESLNKVFAEQGAEMSVGMLRNIVNAHRQLQDFEGAAAAAESYLEAHPEDPGLLSSYASALSNVGRVDDAIDALERVAEIDPAYPDVYIRQGVLLLGEGRIDEAIPVLRQAVEQGTPADQVSDQVFGLAAHSDGPLNSEDWPEAISLIEAAKEFPISDLQGQKLNYYHGYSLLRQGQALQPPDGATVESACRTLPIFQEAQQLLESARPWAQETNNDLAAMLTPTETFVEIQELTIQQIGGGSCGR